MKLAINNLNFKLMKTTIEKSKKYGLYKLGLIKDANLDGLNALLKEKYVTLDEISDIANNASCVLLNKYGYASDREGNPIPEDSAKYRYFETGLISETGEQIIGVLERAKYGAPFTGMTWCTRQDLSEQIGIGNKFHFGELYFDDEARAMAFLEDLAINSQPEDWTFQHRPSKINYPILRSYVENIFNVLRHEAELGLENRLLYSKDNKHLTFNTNLLDRFDHEVWIVMEVRKMQSGKEIFVNPQRVTSKEKLRFLGFDRGAYPQPPRFFSENASEEAHYQKDWDVSEDFEAYNHIFNRLERFPEEYRYLYQTNPDEVARRLNDAILFGVKMAKRNDHFVLPMYNPKDNEVQMLMPIYMNGISGGSPDFALVLSLDKENKYYLPKTILKLEDAYQDARLISVLDGMWLTPKNA